MRPATMIGLAGAVAALALAPLATWAEEQGGGVEAGILRCDTLQDTKLNLLIHSEVDVSCVFETTAGKIERYKGETGIGLGLDLSWDTKQEIAFTVLSGGKDIRAGQHSLAGYYGGGKASIAAGLGAGAAALIGGSDDNIALNPLAMETREGYGIAAGLTYLILEPDTGATQ